MNIFEDLIEELKEEHLLEETVIETNSGEKKSGTFDEIIEAETFLEKLASETEAVEEKESAGDDSIAEQSLDFSLVDGESQSDTETTLEDLPESAVEEQKTEAENETPINTPTNEADFYRQRAIEEVSSLQMVEHILSGIEREQMKVVPKCFDDLEVKKALHFFLQVSGEVNSPEHAQAEFQLMQETESWYSALSYRDKHVSVSNLRRFCETTRPILSSQALISLARFYRNLPYSEAARNKFDFIMTRLFSEEIEENKRKIAFNRDELIKQINELYSAWSANSSYSSDEDESELLLTAFKFEDFMAEADNAESFDELIRSDFFNRLRVFKESTGECFFAPLITAAAIESNVRIGNRYIELLEIERERGTIEKIEGQHGFLHDQAISDATSKTFKLAELLKENKVKAKAKIVEAESFEPEQSDIKREEKQSSKQTVNHTKGSKGKKRGRFEFNKWLLILTVFVIAGSLILHFWATSYAVTEIVSSNVKVVNLDSSSLKEYVKEARINKEIFFGTVQPSWNNLNQEKKEEILKKILSIGEEKGFKSVHLRDETGKTVGAATLERISVY